MTPMAALVLTAIGDERAGLVEELAEVVAGHGASWDRSSMARLGAKFAGIVEVTVPDDRVDELADALRVFSEQGGGLSISIERGVVESAPVAAERRIGLSVVGQDRPGIVHQMSSILARAGASIVELRTVVSSAPMSGEPLFEAHADVLAAGDVDLDGIERALEALGDELMVDVDLDRPD